MAERLLGGRYELQELVAAGGMGEVYRALDRRLGRAVAVKLLHRDFAADLAGIEAFRREARAAAALDHPNIVPVFDYGEEDGIPYLVMALVDGESLASVVKREGALSLQRGLAIARQVVGALAHAHEQGVVHRDVRPQNILLTKEDRAMLGDFGLAAALVDPDLAHSDALAGTAHYLPPERWQGAAATPPSDLYSLGVVLFYMFTGRLPFPGEDPAGLATDHQRTLPPRPAALNPRLPLWLEQVILRCLEKEPAKRPASASALLADLGAAPGLAADDRLAASRQATIRMPVLTPLASTSFPQRWRSRLGLVPLVAALVAVTLALAWPRGGTADKLPPRTATARSAALSSPTARPVATSTIPAPTPTAGFRATTAQQQIAYLRSLIQSSISSGALSPQDGMSLLKTLNELQDLLGKGKPAAEKAQDRLRDLSNRAAELARDGRFGRAEAVKFLEGLAHLARLL